MRRLYIAVVIVAAALASCLVAPAAAASIIYYTDFEELSREMVTLGGVCSRSGGVVTCRDNDMGTGDASYYLYYVDLSFINSLWISSKVRLPAAPSTSVNYGIAVLSSNMDKVYAAVIDGYNGRIYILSYNVESPGGWRSIGTYVTNKYMIPDYDPTKWYIVSFSYTVEYGAVSMYFQVNDTDGNILAEAWATSFFPSGFVPAYIGLVVDGGRAAFDYLLAATAPTVFPATVTSTATVATTVTVTTGITATVTSVVSETVTSAVTSTVPVYVNLYRTVTETVTTMPATAIGIDKFAIAVAILVMVAAVFMLRRR
jgi:hypothetical protein